MYLVLDNSPEQEMIFHYTDPQGVWQVLVCPKTGEESVLDGVAALSAAIPEFEAQLVALGVVVGKGRFTATRVAVTMVNTLAYAWQVPAVALSVFEAENFEHLVRATPVGQYVTATYSAPASVGK